MVEGNDSPPLKKQKFEDIESSEEEDLPDYLKQSENNKQANNNENYYLDTINRQLLDFDFEKICSISLSNVNVYCCLVCGKYFQGRSISSHAYNHSINLNHHVFLNLNSEKFYILPENYELKSPKLLRSLQDIRNLLNPKYMEEDIHNLPIIAYDLNNKPYNVGYIGLNNIAANDYSNVIIQALSHIPPIKDFYLELSYKDEFNERISRKSELNSKFGLLIRKMWSKYLFKNHISPHDLLQFISSSSKKQFSIVHQRSPKKFMIWLLNQLNVQLIKSTKKTKTVFTKTLQGSIEVSQIPIITKEVNNKVEFVTTEDLIVKNQSKFWVLTLNLPSNSIFSKESKIHEVSLVSLLSKYDGETKIQSSSNQLNTYQLLAPLPPYLVFHIDRDLEDETSRGNPTVVKFPDLLDMSPYTKGSKGPINYKLLTNIKHDLISGSELDHNDDKHQWSINLRKENNGWINIKNLEIRSCEYELMFLDQSYIQIWEHV